MLSATPVGITPCNIVRHLAVYSAKLSSVKEVKISTTEVLEELPGIDVTGLSQKEVVKGLSNKTKADIVHNACKEFAKNTQLAGKTNITPEDILDQRGYKSVVICTDCGCAISDYRAFLSHIQSESLSIKYSGFRNTTPYGTFNSISKFLFVKCPSCIEPISWNSLKTKFHQAFYDKKFIDVLEKTYVLQALRTSFPNAIGFCQDSECEGSDGFMLMKTQGQYCRHCNTHHNEQCISGYNMVFCVACKKSHSIELHMTSCPCCKKEFCNICKTNHRGRVCPGSALQTMDPESARLLLNDGMKICPGCSNGIIKTAACDHMKCPCDVHFCYRCNEDITQIGNAHRCATSTAVAGVVDQVFANAPNNFANDEGFEPYNPAAFGADVVPGLLGVDSDSDDDDFIGNH